MRVVFANLQAKPDKGDDAHDTTRLLDTGCDIFGACEVGGHVRALFLKRRLAKAGLSSWAVTPTPLAWPASWTVIAKGKTFLSDRVKNEARHNPRILRAKKAPWVLLHDPMGPLHYVTVAHLAPWADANHVVHSKQVAALAAALVQVKADHPTVTRHAIGDWNTPDRDRLRPITDAGLDLGAITPDLHGHQLSYIASDLKGSRDMIRGLKTDHNAVTADLKGAPVPTPQPGRYDRVEFRGETVDNDTMQRLLIAERRLGYELTIIKGIQQATPGDPSAGTHNGPAIDLSPFDWKRKVRVLRDLGFAIWRRPKLVRSDGTLVWNEHIHGVPIGNPNLSPEAQAQVAQYFAGLNGLADHARDTDPYRPSPPVEFDYQAALADTRTRGRITGLKARIKTLRDRISANRNRITYK